jgi:hypothetical protein
MFDDVRRQRKIDVDDQILGFVMALNPVRHA